MTLDEDTSTGVDDATVEDERKRKLEYQSSDKIISNVLQTTLIVGFQFLSSKSRSILKPKTSRQSNKTLTNPFQDQQASFRNLSRPLYSEYYSQCVWLQWRVETSCGTSLATSQIRRKCWMGWTGWTARTIRTILVATS